MNLIVAGGRDFTNQQFMLQSLASIDQLSELESITLICGMARGADRTAFNLWQGINYPIVEMPADWDTFGRSAGYIRNTEMAALADALVAFWDGSSRGTKHMIDTMTKLNKPVWIFHY